MIRLGVNVDHVATVRNARGTVYPQPTQAAALAEVGGADNITCHLREDRRHIVDNDVRALKESVALPLNFEMAVTDEMLEIALAVSPHAVSLVPEKREELTTEGGLDLDFRADRLATVIAALKDAGILVSLFIEPKAEDIKKAAKLGADAVELHTGHYCLAMDATARLKEKISLTRTLKGSCAVVHSEGLACHVGHGLNYQNAQWLQCLPFVEEANIGHSIVARALFVGFEAAVREMKALLNDRTFWPVPKEYGDV